MSRISLLLASTVLLLIQASRVATERPESDRRPEAVPHAEVVAVRDLGPLQFLEVIRGRDGGYSARFGNRSVWVFGDSVLNTAGEDGSRWRSSTWCWTRDFVAEDGIQQLTEPLDSKGAPGEFLPFTEAELAYNRAHFRQDIPEDERSRWALWPGPVIVAPGTGKVYVFYSKIFGRTGAFNFDVKGHSLALWQAPDRPIVRPEVRDDTDDSTILFPENDVVLGQGAVAVGEWLYAYGCQTVGLSWPCIVARVKLADALKRDAWQFFAAGGRWSKNWRDAVSVMQAAPQLTVHWNKHLGKYLAVYSTPLVNSISIRTATRPEGPWSDSQVVTHCLAPTNKEMWVYCSMAHPEFARDNGRTEYLTYYRETGFLMGEIRLVEVTFR